MAEIELSILSRQCLERRILDSETLQQAVATWVKQHHAHPNPMQWRFTTEEARIKLNHLYPTINHYGLKVHSIYCGLKALNPWTQPRIEIMNRYAMLNYE